MFTRIMVPVDLSHRDKMTRALDIATEWARLHDGSLLLVSVESDQPSSVARNRTEFVAKLEAMARELAEKTGLTVESEPGIGTRFTLTVPVAIGDPEHIERAEEHVRNNEEQQALDTLREEFGSECDSEQPAHHEVSSSGRLSLCHRHKAEHEEPDTFFDRTVFADR